ncbi:MAG: type III polyketide synthase [Desulfuromonadaceae bacterium]|nr:type III polyketide synthase [Desulfuromonadaceae bacterium]
MSVWIQNIATMTPGVAYTQTFASEKMQGWTADERLKRMVRILYQRSGIEQRYSVIKSFDDNSDDDFFPLTADGLRRERTTAERNAIYRREAHHLSVDLARKTIAESPGIAPGDITHVITISCTGFYNPGPDYQIISELGLPSTTQRYNLGFMGCYAFFPGLRMATQFCQANPAAVVLVMCLELCSIHLQLNGRDDSMLANSLFADGAGAAIISTRQPLADQSCYRLDDFHSTLIPDGAADMAWTIGDLGFDIALSSYVPKIIGANIREVLQPILGEGHCRLNAIDTWAIHPGGKAIIDKVAESLELDESQIAASRNVLRQYGNMSSATILFVLQQILQNRAGSSREKVCAMAFGPGLTVEMALFEAQRAVNNETKHDEPAIIPVAASQGC